MSYEINIQGLRVIPGFNGNGNIYLEDYLKNGIQPPTIKSGTFSHIGVLDLNTVDEDDDKWLNIGIREEGNTEERIEAFENKYEVEGWKTSYVPPLMGTNGDPRDGRGRIIAAKRRGERYIPVYYYVIDNDSEKSRVTDGLTENLRHDPSFGATMESVTIGCLYLIKMNELKLTEAAVRNYLNTEIHIENHFAAHNITKIVNSVLKRGVGGGDPLILVKDRDKWESFCKKAGKTVDNKTVFLMSADSETYAFRAWCQHVLPAIVKSDTPVEIILYTNKHIPAEATKNMQLFQTKLEYYLEASYLMVGKDYGLTFPVKEHPYTIVGCIPQVVGKHDGAYKAHRFIAIKDY